MRSLLWYVFIGSRGGETRMRIVESIIRRPKNPNMLKVELVMDYSTIRHNLRVLEKNRIVVLAAGTGNPYFTTDTAAALRAIEIGADVILKATKVDGIYTADPMKDPAATRFTTMNYMEILNRGLKVMDSTAISLCMDNQLPLIVFNVGVRGNMLRVVQGEAVGTTVKES